MDEVRALRPIRMNWDQFLEKNSKGDYVYPDNVFTTKRKSWYMLWNADEIDAVEDQLTIYTNLPMKCKGDACPFADRCPLISAGVINRAVGKDCPLEIVDAFRHFAGYINDLEIKPTDYTDIQLVNDLVRLQINLARCDKFLKKEDPFEVLVAGVDAKTTLVHKSRGPHALITQQKMLRQDINAIYEKLIASRSAKASANRKASNTDIVSAMTERYEKMRKEREAKEAQGTPDFDVISKLEA